MSSESEQQSRFQQQTQALRQIRMDRNKPEDRSDEDSDHGEDIVTKTSSTCVRDGVCSDLDSIGGVIASKSATAKLEKTLPCSQCTQLFTRKGNLVKHIKELHGDKKSKESISHRTHKNAMQSARRKTRYNEDPEFKKSEKARGKKNKDKAKRVKWAAKRGIVVQMAAPKTVQTVTSGVSSMETIVSTTNDTSSTGEPTTSVAEDTASITEAMSSIDASIALDTTLVDTSADVNNDDFIVVVVNKEGWTRKMQRE
jgi:uncharacterized C2H2 Zn-finger protein